MKGLNKMGACTKSPTPPTLAPSKHEKAKYPKMQISKIVTLKKSKNFIL